MHNFKYKHMLIAIGVFLLASIAALWSWNTLSELFSFPQAQYRHVIAAFILLLIVKWGVSSWHRTAGHLFGRAHEHPTH